MSSTDPLRAFYERLRDSQEPLGEEFARVLAENAWDLYVREPMIKHYVKFFSPGTFVSEPNDLEIDSWSVDAAREMAKGIKQRYGATPYGFYFYTKERKEADWEPKQTAASDMYYLPHCKLETLEEIKARNLPDERILRSNMECNEWDTVVTTTEGWKITQPFNKDKDTLLS